MESSLQVLGSHPIVQDYERDPVFVSLKTANEALKTQVDDLNKRLAFTETLLAKRFNVNFEAAIKEMCRFVKQDKALSKQLKASLKDQNTENSLKLLEILVSETGPEEGFILCEHPKKNDEKTTDLNPEKLHDELSYYLNQLKGNTLSDENKIGIQSALEETSKEFIEASIPFKSLSITALKATWTVSKILYKESLRLGTFVLSATPLILFCLLVNEINKLTRGWAFNAAISGLSLIGRAL